MSWIGRLYKTYEDNSHAIGDRNESVPLLPICHTTQMAHVQIVLDGDGRFVRASVVPKSEARTVIPATEESAGRTSGRVAHPLCDKLQYVARDYAEYGGDMEACYEKYMESLNRWLAADTNQPKLRAVATYVNQGRVIADLVRSSVLWVDEDSTEEETHSRLRDHWQENNHPTPEIFRLLPGGLDSHGKGKPWQADAFVRWLVEIPNDPQTELWLDHGLWSSWERYYGTLKERTGLCHVTGQSLPLADQHPAKIRNDGDKAKLISSNDSSGFTFRGRFVSADEACGVGFQVTQKAHNALRWLIARQGHRDGDQAIVAWAVSGADVPDPLVDTLTFLRGADGASPPLASGYTAQEVGRALSTKLAGYSATLGNTDEVTIIVLDSATPGRLAIRYYRELTGSELLTRVQSWHEGCCWLQRFGKDRVFVGAPAPRDIAEAAYGSRLDGKLRRSTVERLLPCIVEGGSIPRDLVEACVRRAANRNGIEPWEWEKSLGIACALFKYIHKERGYTMALDRERKTRDYLYGRLLALAEHLESRALYVGGERRATNAEKLMQRFSERPHTTWLLLETALAPYSVRLSTKRPGFLYEVKREMDAVMDAFVIDEFTCDKRLTGEFLLGYHCQRAALRPEREVETDTDSNQDH